MNSAAEGAGSSAAEGSVRESGRTDLVTAWLAAEPDKSHRTELAQHLSGVSDGNPESAAWLAEHFDKPLTFGTAGLRAQLGPGPARMNRLMVRLTARAIGQVLVAECQAERGVVIGFDARYGSAEFAEDSARLLAGMGVPAALINGVVPTPVLAHQLLAREAGAAIMVTASHNPRDDNGYKVYWGDGTQIRPPIDALIETRIQAQLQGCDLAADTDLAPLHEVELIEPQTAIADYVGTAIAPYNSPDSSSSPGSHGSSSSPTPAAQDHTQFVYTALCGVGTDTLKWALAVAGLAPPVLVEHQCRPDPAFTDLPFPNPEEPGTLDAALALADERRIDLVLANDPDADRLAVAVRTTASTAAGTVVNTTAGTASGWRRLTGDELGVLLCDHMIEQTRIGEITPDGTTPDEAAPDGITSSPPSPRRLAVSSVVSGSMVKALCEARGVEHHRTLTGFKWVMLPRIVNPDATWVFGYEEALGYSVTDAVLDKDGISAAVEFVRLSQTLATRGIGPLERLDELAQEIGVFETRQVSVRTDVTAIAGTIARLRSNPPSELFDERSSYSAQGSSVQPARTAPADIFVSSVSDMTVAGTAITDIAITSRAITSRANADPETANADPGTADIVVLNLFGQQRRTDLYKIHFDAPASNEPPLSTEARQPQPNQCIYIRASGTEPKVKIYLEASLPGPVAAHQLAQARSRCIQALDNMAAAAVTWFE